MLRARFFISFVLFASAACDAPSPAADALPYEGCISPDDADPTCGDGESACMDTAYWPPAQMCSFVCTVDADCPAIEGQSAVCQAFVGEGRRMCALPCDPDADVDTCPLATSCETAERYDGTEVSLCLPY